MYVILLIASTTYDALTVSDYAGGDCINQAIAWNIYEAVKKRCASHSVFVHSKEHMF